jgi:hypothetical protein
LRHEVTQLVLRMSGQLFSLAPPTPQLQPLLVCSFCVRPSLCSSAVLTAAAGGEGEKSALSSHPQHQLCVRNCVGTAFPFKQCCAMQPSSNCLVLRFFAGCVTHVYVTRLLHVVGQTTV